LAYDSGYKNGQRDLVEPPHVSRLTEGQRDALLMRLTLSPTRRYLGWVVMIGGVIGHSIPFLAWYFTGCVSARFVGSSPR
jgi:hypothetical protein